MKKTREEVAAKKELAFWKQLEKHIPSWRVYGWSGLISCAFLKPNKRLIDLHRDEFDAILAACEKPEPALLKELPECDQRIIRSMLKRKITTDSPTPYDRELDACEKRSCPLGHSSCELNSNYRPVDLDKAKPRKRCRK